LNGRIDVLLDGGPCPGGIESTVVDVTGEVPRVLRPGLVTVPMLESVCGRMEIGAKEAGVARSPGQMAKHYSPRAEVVLASCTKEAYRLLGEGQAAGLRVVILGFAQPERPPVVAHYRPMIEEPEQCAADLYRMLHQVDAEGWDRVVIEMPLDTPEWAAIRDRLTRAAAKG
jgi:L-threonylcarbamoyladenylate synthase